MPGRRPWTRNELLLAFDLYCRLPFGRLHARNPTIIEAAHKIGRTPSALAMKLTNLASLDPDITRTGRKGLRGASSTDRAMWKEMHDDWEAFVEESREALKSFELDSNPEDDETSMEDAEYYGQSKELKVKTRVGQRFFRRSVLSSYNECCCISGLSIPALLVASHIVPWRADPKNRLNPRNGLCLSAIHDRAFDTGLITITEDMKVRVSTKLRSADDPFFESSIMAFDGTTIELPEKFRPSELFLHHHRTIIFMP